QQQQGDTKASPDAAGATPAVPSLQQLLTSPTPALDIMQEILRGQQKKKGKTGPETQGAPGENMAGNANEPALRTQLIVLAPQVQAKVTFPADAAEAAVIGKRVALDARGALREEGLLISAHDVRAYTDFGANSQVRTQVELLFESLWPL